MSIPCAIVFVATLATRPSGGLAVPKGVHVVYIDEHDFGIQVPDVTIPPGHYVFVDTTTARHHTNWSCADSADNERA